MRRRLVLTISCALVLTGVSGCTRKDGRGIARKEPRRVFVIVGDGYTFDRDNVREVSEGIVVVLDRAPCGAKVVVVSNILLGRHQAGIEPAPWYGASVPCATGKSDGDELIRERYSLLRHEVMSAEARVKPGRRMDTRYALQLAGRHMGVRDQRYLIVIGDDEVNEAFGGSAQFVLGPSSLNLARTTAYVGLTRSEATRRTQFQGNTRAILIGLRVAPEAITQEYFTPGGLLQWLNTMAGGRW